MKKKVIIFSSLILFLFVMGFTYSYHDQNIHKENKKDIKREITITATGDIMFHLMTYMNNYDEATGKYDFSSFYEKMKPYIDDTDVMAANYESTSLPGRLYSGFPCFNTPPDSIEYLKNTGVN